MELIQNITPINIITRISKLSDLLLIVKYKNSKFFIRITNKNCIILLKIQYVRLVSQWLKDLC